MDRLETGVLGWQGKINFLNFLEGDKQYMFFIQNRKNKLKNNKINVEHKNKYVCVIRYQMRVCSYQKSHIFIK